MELPNPDDKIRTTKRYIVLIFLIFVLVFMFYKGTKYIYPNSLYHEYTSHFPGYPHSLEAIPTLTIYKNAGIAVMPWITLSPWTFVDARHNFQDTAGLALLIIIPVVFLVWEVGLSLLLILILRPGKTRKISILILVILWLTYVIYGAGVVYKVFIAVPQKYNHALNKLSVISGSNPFPSDTSIFKTRFNYESDQYLFFMGNREPDFELSLENNFWADIYFYSINTEDLLKRCGNGEVIFEDVRGQYSTDDPLAPSSKYFPFGDYRMVKVNDKDKTDYVSEESPGIFNCGRKVDGYGKDYSLYVGYLDASHTIYFMTTGPFKSITSTAFPNDRLIPDFVKYYLREK
jgi:hypothetical protein